MDLKVDTLNDLDGRPAMPLMLQPFLESPPTTDSTRRSQRAPHRQAPHHKASQGLARHRRHRRHHRHRRHRRHRRRHEASQGIAHTAGIAGIAGIAGVARHRKASQGIAHTAGIARVAGITGCADIAGSAGIVAQHTHHAPFTTHTASQRIPPPTIPTLR